MSDYENKTTSKVTFGTYGKSFQEKIGQALLTDQKWAEQMTEVFDFKDRKKTRRHSVGFFCILISAWHPYAKSISQRHGGARIPLCEDPPSTRS